MAPQQPLYVKTVALFILFSIYKGDKNKSGIHLKLNYGFQSSTKEFLLPAQKKHF